MKMTSSCYGNTVTFDLKENVWSYIYSCMLDLVSGHKQNLYSRSTISTKHYLIQTNNLINIEHVMCTSDL